MLQYPVIYGKWDMVTDGTVQKVSFANGFATLIFAKLHAFLHSQNLAREED